MSILLWLAIHKNCCTFQFSFGWSTTWLMFPTKYCFPSSCIQDKSLKERTTNKSEQHISLLKQTKNIGLNLPPQPWPFVAIFIRFASAWFSRKDCWAADNPKSPTRPLRWYWFLTRLRGVHSSFMLWKGDSSSTSTMPRVYVKNKGNRNQKQNNEHGSGTRTNEPMHNGNGDKRRRQQQQ